MKERAASSSEVLVKALHLSAKVVETAVAKENEISHTGFLAGRKLRRNALLGLGGGKTSLQKAFHLSCFVGKNSYDLVEFGFKGVFEEQRHLDGNAFGFGLLNRMKPFLADKGMQQLLKPPPLRRLAEYYASKTGFVNRSLGRKNSVAEFIPNGLNDFVLLQEKAMGNLVRREAIPAELPKQKQYRRLPAGNGTGQADYDSFVFAGKLH